LSKKLLNYNPICSPYFVTFAEEFKLSIIEASSEVSQTHVERMTTGGRKYEYYL
jgi:hypothetical protein